MTYHTSKYGSDSSIPPVDSPQKILPFPGVALDPIPYTEDVGFLDLTTLLKDANPRVSMMRIQDIMYKGVFGCEASELRQILQRGLNEDLRDHLSVFGMQYVRIAEEKLRQYFILFTDPISCEKIYELARVFAEEAGQQARAAAESRYIDIDLITGLTTIYFDDEDVPF